MVLELDWLAEGQYTYVRVYIMSPQCSFAKQFCKKASKCSAMHQRAGSISLPENSSLSCKMMQQSNLSRPDDVGCELFTFTEVSGGKSWELLLHMLTASRFFSIVKDAEVLLWDIRSSNKAEIWMRVTFSRFSFLCASANLPHAIWRRGLCTCACMSTLYL